MNSQNEELRTQLKESRAFEKALQQQIRKAEEVNQQYEKLKMFSNAKEVEDQLSRMQRKMINVKSSFGSIDVKLKYIEEVRSYTCAICTVWLQIFVTQYFFLNFIITLQITKILHLKISVFVNFLTYKLEELGF